MLEGLSAGRALSEVSELTNNLDPLPAMSGYVLITLLRTCYSDAMRQTELIKGAGPNVSHALMIMPVRRQIVP